MDYRSKANSPSRATFFALSVVTSAASFAGSGCHSTPTSDGTAAAATPSTSARPVRADFDIAVIAKGFMPSQIHWTHGTPLTITFRRTDPNACGGEVTFPDLNIVRPLPMGVDVTVSIPSTIPGQYDFKCGTSPFAGRVLVL